MTNEEKEQWYNSQYAFERVEEAQVPLSFCPCHPPITAYKILVDDTGREISRERVGGEPEQHCPHCGKLWSDH